MDCMERCITDLGGIAVTELAHRHGTPFFVYDQAVIEKRISELESFDVIRFAQKACSNLAILTLMRKRGVVVDAVSAGEIVRALRVGYTSAPTGPKGVPGIVFTADLFDDDVKALIREHKLPVNVGSLDMIEQLGEFAPGTEVILRLNPGFGHGHSRKTNTGGEWSKHGIWHTQLEEALRLGEAAGVHIVGLHMHIGSGTDFDHLSTVCDAMVKAAKRFGPALKIVSAGGGLPIPYRKNQARIDLKAYYELWDKAHKLIERDLGHPVTLEVEPGRYLVAESGSLVTTIRSVKKQGDNLFYAVDAGFDTLVRPAMYGSYHEILIATSDDRVPTRTVDAVVSGPLCESGDVFTQEEGGVVVTRKLPEARVGDYLVLLDTGAYGAVMSSNYNTRRYAPEVLLLDGSDEVIRHRQTFEHLLQNECVPERLKS
jgi:diaminopimelate decarboxylase